MKIYPRLRKAVNTNDVVSEGVFTVRMTKDTNSLTNEGSKPNIPLKFSVIEA